MTCWGITEAPCEIASADRAVGEPMSAICDVDLATFCGRIGNLYGRHCLCPPFALHDFSGVLAVGAGVVGETLLSPGVAPCASTGAVSTLAATGAIATLQIMT